MTKLTVEQKQKYLSGKGHRCPICESENIEGQGMQFDGWTDEASEKVRCGGCGAEWVDIYDIVDIRLTKQNRK